MNALRTGNTDYAVVKHLLNDHKGETPNYAFILHKTWKSSLERQIGEALLIDDTPRGALINSKAEVGHNTISRLKVEAGTEEIRHPHN